MRLLETSAPLAPVLLFPEGTEVGVVGGDAAATAVTSSHTSAIRIIYGRVTAVIT